MSLVDVHAHFLTPDYVAAARDAGHTRPDGMPAWPSWSAGRHLELMDESGIARSVLSVSSPGVHFGDDALARALARRMNETAAGLVRDHPRRFGFFASLPDPAGAVAEVDHALGALGADGVVVLSNLGGRYLGDPCWEELWQELDARAAVVFVHPTSPPHWDSVAPGRPRPMIEFLFDGARTVLDLLLNGVLVRYPRIRFIVTHGGGVLPLLADRVELFRQAFSAGSDDLPGTAEQLRTLWYDLAGTPLPNQLPALEAVVGTGQLLYGSDYCFTPAEAVARQVATLGASVRELTTVNAARLLVSRPEPPG